MFDSKLPSTLRAYEQFIRVYFKRPELTFTEVTNTHAHMPLPNGRTYSFALGYLPEGSSAGAMLDTEAKRLELLLLPAIPDLEVPSHEK